MKAAKPIPGPAERRPTNKSPKHSDQKTLDEAVAYIAQDSLPTALALLELVLETAGSLTVMSERGRVVPELEQPQIRELLVRRYRLIYEVLSSIRGAVSAPTHGADSAGKRYTWRMTPEQRLDRIEAILEKHNQTIERHNQEIDKQNAGIRDLVVVSRTVLTSIQELGTSVQQLRDSQAATDEKLNILIDTVDRIIRHRNGKE